MIIFRVGLLLAFTVAVITTEEEEVIKCPDGECVKLHLCVDGKINDDGTNIIDIRFNPDDPCEHYLLKCCGVRGEEEDFEVPLPSVPLPSVPLPPDVEPIDHGPQGGGPNQQYNENLNGNGGSKPDTSNRGQTNVTIQPGGPHVPGQEVQPDKLPVQPEGHPHIPTETKGCGYRNADGVGFRITGDSDGESEYGEFPWMVAILKEEKALDRVINVYQCGGSLIHPRVVLTAAHCVQNKQSKEIKVRLGEWDTQTTNEIYEHQDRNVVEIVVHDKFYKGGLFNDVALLFLDRLADISETVDTICLPPQDFNFDLQRCFASGWGKDVFGKEGKYQVILKKIELPVMPFAQCQSALRTTRLGKRFILNKSFICAGGEPGKDTCKGDGGSPLVCPIPGTTNRFYQAGIVAWGIGCGEIGIPGVYANVAGFRHWIDEHLTQRNIPHTYYLLA